MISKKKIIPLAVIAAAVIVAVIVVMSFVRGRDDGTMKLSGNVEVTECNVGFKVAGKIRALTVDEGSLRGEGEGDLIAEPRATREDPRRPEQSRAGGGKGEACGVEGRLTSPRS